MNEADLKTLLVQTQNAAIDLANKVITAELLLADVRFHLGDARKLIGDGVTTHGRDMAKGVLRLIDAEGRLVEAMEALRP